MNNSNEITSDALKAIPEEEKINTLENKLNFGTAGIRGIIGIGPNKINKSTIAMASYGTAKYLLDKYNDQKIKVVIGSDNRQMHKEFIDVSSGIFSSFGIEVYYEEIIPTPFISFAINKLHAQAGINITASHNPPNYNGYKVFDNEGMQILENETQKILKFSKETPEFNTYKYKKNKLLIKHIPEYIFDMYKTQVAGLIDKNTNLKNIKIVYSSLHGAGYKFVPSILKKFNAELINVKEQISFDENFSYAKNPNPELASAYEKAFDYLKKNQADLILINDPDADRLGVAISIKNKKIIFNGNEVATLIFDYLLQNSKLTSNNFLVYSIVSSDICRIMAEKRGVKTIRVATGFKYVGNVIKKYPHLKFLFGFEESYGYLIDHNISKDKDAIQAALIIANIASMTKRRGQNLKDIINDIYKKHGYFKYLNNTIEIDAINFKKIINNYMNKLRKKQISIQELIEIEDYINGVEDIDATNLLKFNLTGGSWVSVRPSGTEHKIKFYGCAYSKYKMNMHKEAKKVKRCINQLMGVI